MDQLVASRNLQSTGHGSNPVITNFFFAHFQVVYQPQSHCFIKANHYRTLKEATRWHVTTKFPKPTFNLL